MPIETSLAKKVTRFHNSNDCFLAALGNDGELNLALLDVKNCVRNLTLRKNNLILVIFRYCFSLANLGEKYFGMESIIPALFHKHHFPYEVSQASQLYSDSDPKIITGLVSRCRALPRKFSQRLAVISTTYEKPRAGGWWPL